MPAPVLRRCCFGAAEIDRDHRCRALAGSIHTRAFFSPSPRIPSALAARFTVSQLNGCRSVSSRKHPHCYGPCCQPLPQPLFGLLLPLRRGIVARRPLQQFVGGELHRQIVPDDLRDFGAARAALP